MLTAKKILFSTLLLLTFANTSTANANEINTDGNGIIKIEKYDGTGYKTSDPLTLDIEMELIWLPPLGGRGYESGSHWPVLIPKYESVNGIGKFVTLYPKGNRGSEWVEPVKVFIPQYYDHISNKVEHAAMKYYEEHKEKFKGLY
ncbi:hypothetical protein [Streptococcus dysgalactiae]|uniref:hypothetical protein n=1 Tax=Streptococcus dysgalactiae TaxID=1334 RepID=UPI0001F86258|nr:hypothetical protein [Streptococcus dysgalactiae]EFY03724.1 hypothetical protein SDD27957_10715 [Streptococcus dysgalactiae subsp. dysgalactiae ATCC 27957]MCB2829832.1 hypothetical protein [Streptococcus dysgalactiae subsp. dysgalactiae]MCB2831060.1 hypothetical protein [Streptococcus dysgalactiae subsp. dysgalactiae]MCB2835157.1 hypothetical protein [Streptococcus dysgalactiae subsp. dysgalactiae]MCB2836749.1 hypothetical protein [Streptococcus dysgalactiae subsp. dysgalactiae]